MVQLHRSAKSSVNRHLAAWVYVEAGREYALPVSLLLEGAKQWTETK